MFFFFLLLLPLFVLLIVIFVNPILFFVPPLCTYTTYTFRTDRIHVQDLGPLADANGWLS